MNKEESRRAVLSEYDRWAKQHPNKASMMGGFLFFRYLQEERPKPSRFPRGWQQVANRSRLASKSVERLASEPTADYVRFTPKFRHRNSVADLLDYLVGAGEQRVRHVEAERLPAHTWSGPALEGPPASPP